MLYWYRDLMVDDSLKRKTERHIFRVERYYRALPKSKIFRDKKSWWERYVGKKIPWRDYVVMMRASNPDNLFDIMGIRQWIFRHYERTDMYVVGIFSSEYVAINHLEALLSEGYEKDPDYDPRKKFENDEDYVTYTAEEVGAVQPSEAEEDEAAAEESQEEETVEQ